MVEYPLPIRTIEEIVAAAAAAPSLHNSQPWRFRLDGDTIELHLDRSRLPEVADPAGREAQVGSGAALFNLRVAVAAHGRQPVVALLPRPNSDTLLAMVRVAGPRRVSAADKVLYTAIPWRHTNRGPFEDSAIPEWLRMELEDAARAEGAQLRFPRATETGRVLDLVAEAEEKLSRDPAYRQEMARWTTSDPTCGEGVPDTNFGPTPAGRAVPLRDYTPGTRRRPRPATYESQVQLAVLETPVDAPADRLRAGQALQRILLTATLHDVAASFMTQPLEDGELRQAVRGFGVRSGHIQMIVRLGYPRRAVRATPRRDVSDLLEIARG